MAISERTSTLHCVNEVTYPLVTFVLIFDSFSLLLVLLIRAPLKYRQVLKGDASIYLTLCLLPAHALIHVVFGGLLYYVFPYLVTVRDNYFYQWTDTCTQLGMIILQTARMSKELRRVRTANADRAVLTPGCAEPYVQKRYIQGCCDSVFHVYVWITYQDIWLFCLALLAGLRCGKTILCVRRSRDCTGCIGNRVRP